MEFVVKIDETENPEGAQTILDGMVSYNYQFIGLLKPSPFFLYIEDDEGNIISGMVGTAEGKYAFIKWMWTADQYRKQGLSTKIFNTLLELLKNKTCQFILLETGDYQARPLYEKWGFEVVGTVSKWIEGHDFYYMRKNLE